MARVYISSVINASAEKVWERVRDFNGLPKWHPRVRDSRIEDALPADKVGCVRNFRLADGANLREQLLTLSDLEQTFTYCLLDTPVPLFNYVAHVRLFPITDGDRTFWEWESRFDTPAGRGPELTELVGEGIYVAGFDAVKAHMEVEDA